ncbi:MAG: amidohydrolase [Gemmatimonas sp.]|nr:amidohydrolase [Gemmatimonas sp.]
MFTRKVRQCSSLPSLVLLVGGSLMTASCSGASSARADGSSEVVVDEGTSMSVAVSPDGSTLAIDLQGVLWLVPAEGGTAQPITDVFNDARQPAWSPDGDLIAFQSFREGSFDLWVISPDGNGLRSLTTAPYDDREPAWSHDGTRLAFSSDRGDEGFYDIWVLEIATGELQRITDGASNDFMPTWSPDDSELAFASPRVDDQEIWAIDLETGAQRKVSGQGVRADAPSWGPDGQIVYHALDSGSSRLELEGTPLTEEENAFPFRVGWVSPTDFFYVADGRIRRRSIAGGGATEVAFSATLDVTPARYARSLRDLDSREPRQAVGIVRPQISPDGETVVFAALGDIWMMPVGDEPINLTSDPFLATDPAWSPDGSQIAYASDKGGGTLDLWIRGVEGGQERQVTFLPSSAMAPAWSPDGSRIAFLNVDGFWRRANVSVVDVASGTVTIVQESSFGPGTPTWSPAGDRVAFAALDPYSSRFREGLNQVLTVPASGTVGEPRWYAPAEHESIDSRVGAGPVWSPDGSMMAMVYGGRLAVVSVSPTGEPLGPPRQVTSEMAHAPSWTGDSRQLLYQSMDRLRLVDVESSETQTVPLRLEYAPSIPSERRVIRAGLLVDGISPTPREAMDIVLDGNRIVDIVPSGAAGYDDAEIIDASGLTVMPGLIDYHSHLQDDLGEAHGRAWLSFGVTTVRSPGGTPYEAVENREAVEAGARVGPRIYTAGYLMEWQRAYYKMGVAIANEDHLELELERARALQHDMIKSYVRMPDLQQRRIVEFAHEMGVPASSHEIYPAAMLGIDGVEHAGGTSRRGYSPKAATLQKSYGDVAGILGAAGMTFAPTLALGGVWMQDILNTDPALRTDPRFDLLPAWLRESTLAPRPGSPPPGGGAQGQMVMAIQEAGGASWPVPIRPFRRVCTPSSPHTWRPE